MAVDERKNKGSIIWVDGRGMESARGEKRGRAHDHVITQDFKIHKSR